MLKGNLNIQINLAMLGLRLISVEGKCLKFHPKIPFLRHFKFFNFSCFPSFMIIFIYNNIPLNLVEVR